MNVLDVKIAIDDLIKHHDVKLNENVYVKGYHGGELIDGFDVVETNNFTGVFVLDSRGKPAVSSRVVEDLKKKIEKYREVLEFYANEKNHEREWDTFTDSGVEKSEVMKDGGEKARQALKGEA